MKANVVLSHFVAVAQIYPWCWAVRVKYLPRDVSNLAPLSSTSSAASICATCCSKTHFAYPCVPSFCAELAIRPFPSTFTHLATMWSAHILPYKNLHEDYIKMTSNNLTNSPTISVVNSQQVALVCGISDPMRNDFRSGSFKIITRVTPTGVYTCVYTCAYRGHILVGTQLYVYNFLLRE